MFINNNELHYDYSQDQNNIYGPELELVLNDPILITGQILDTDGVALNGASVQETTNLLNGTATDIDGLFSMRVSNLDRLDIRHLGHVSQTIQAIEQPQTIVMTMDENQLDTVVIDATNKTPILGGTNASLKYVGIGIAVIAFLSFILKYSKGTSKNIDGMSGPVNIIL
jgi:hypothetical protein